MLKRITMFIKSKTTTLTLLTVGILIVYSLVGIFTLGTTKTPSSSFYAERINEEDLVVVKVSLEFEEGQTLKEIWINAGLMETKANEVGSIEFRISQTQSSEDRFIGSAILAGVDSTKTDLFNWKKLYSSLNHASDYKYITVKFKTDIFVNELVFLDANSKPIKISGLNNQESQNFLGHKMFDEQASFTKQINYLSTITGDEAYTLSSVLSLMKTRGYIIDGEANALGTQILAIGVAIFGANTFGIRIMPFLFSIATLILLYVLGKKLFKSEWISTLFITLMVIGGLFTTIGSSGNVRPIFAFFALLSLFFMYEYYNDSVMKVATNKSVKNILLSGLFFSLAIAISTGAIFALIAILVLFFAGIFRQRTAYKNLIKKATQEKTDTKKLKQVLKDKEKVGYLLSLTVFVLLPIMLLTISYIPSFSALNLHYKKTNFFNLMIVDIMNYFKYANANELFKTNLSGIFNSLVGLKQAVLFDATDKALYFKVIATINPVMSIMALIFLVFVTLDVIKYALAEQVHKSDYDVFNNTIRPFVFLLAGFLAFTLPFLFKKSVSSLDFYMASIFYIGMIALYVKRIDIISKNQFVFAKKGKGIEKSKFFAIIITAVCLINFGMLVPIYFGIPMGLTAAKIFLSLSSIKAVLPLN